MTFDATTITFTINSSTLTDASINSIIVTGTVGVYGDATLSFTITLVNPCPTATISPSSITT